jgi:NAD+ synthase (glutamine-hydrolysing)
MSCQLITQAEDVEEEEGITRLHLPPIDCPTILRHVIDPPLDGPASPGVVADLEWSLCDMTPQKLLSFSFKFVNLCTVIPCLAVRPSLLPASLQACRDVRLFNFDASQAAQALSQGSIPLAAIADGRAEWTGDYRRIRGELIRRSLVDRSIILYAGAGLGESSSQGVYAGHRLIVSDGRVLAEGQSFTSGITLADISPGDLFQVRRDRESRWDILKDDLLDKAGLTRPDSLPFLMRESLDRTSFYQETLAIQARGLADRLDFLGARPILGLSGGLDSAHALLVCLEALRLLERPASDLLALYMPGPGSSTKSGKLAKDLGLATQVDFRVIDISQAVKDHLAAIGHGGDLDLTFENAQARERTKILMDLSNLQGGIVVGTGDLSELALGWSTYNGDHMSMYAVNASLTKTVIQEMVAMTIRLLEKGQSPLMPDPDKAQLVAASLAQILARPVSPELLPPGPQDQLIQLTEDLVGPYALVDFFLWHLIFHGQKVTAVYRLALEAFGSTYPASDIRRWLAGFIRRFFKNQFKRSASPEGVAAFPWQLVPQMAWQMPGDALAQVWLRELELLEEESRG